MKKLMCMFSMLALILCSCSPFSQSSGEKQPDSANSQLSEGTPPPLMNPLEYDTVGDLSRGISKGFSETDLQDIEKEEAGEKRGAFRAFIENRKAQNNLYVPYIKDKPITLRDEEGFSNILLFPSEIHRQPTIWFFFLAGGSNSFINTTYVDSFLSQDTMKEANEKGYSWLIKQIDPAMLNVDNLKSFPEYADTIKDIYEKEIILKKKKVEATIYEYYDDPRLHVYFVYDNLLIRVTSMPETLTPEWYECLDFKPVPLN